MPKVVSAAFVPAPRVGGVKSRSWPRNVGGRLMKGLVCRNVWTDGKYAGITANHADASGETQSNPILRSVLIDGHKVHNVRYLCGTGLPL